LTNTRKKYVRRRKEKHTYCPGTRLYSISFSLFRSLSFPSSNGNPTHAKKKIERDEKSFYKARKSYDRTLKYENICLWLRLVKVVKLKILYFYLKLFYKFLFQLIYFCEDFYGSKQDLSRIKLIKKKVYDVNIFLPASIITFSVAVMCSRVCNTFNIVILLFLQLTYVYESLEMLTANTHMEHVYER
jgi:hypothetical protein